MIMITSNTPELARTAREIFFTMGYLSDTASPCDAPLLLCDRHRAVVALGRESERGWHEVVSAVRLIHGEIPFIAIREDITGGTLAAFDRVYPNSVYSALAVGELRALARSRGLMPVGEYSVSELCASVEGGAPSFAGKPIGLTKTEAMVLRTVIAFGGEGVSVPVILSHAFRTARAPSEAGVRTHISSINRKLRAISERACIRSGEGGYYLDGVREALTV